jgi:seryl-tRNA synthetase
MSSPLTESSANAAAERLESIRAAIFHRIGADGVYARTGLYEEVLQALTAFITRQRDPRAEVLRFPPVMSRSQLEKSGYLKSFPNLLGCVCALHGSEGEIRAAADSHQLGGDWTRSLAPSDLVLSPAACYPVYPLAAERGRVPNEGWLFDVAADCFRREPSRALDRLQSFRMREFVRIGSPEAIQRFRDDWLRRAIELARELTLPCELEMANDPFFGRVGQLMGVLQRQQSLKFELLIPYHTGAKPTACMSFNYHRDHFGATWGLESGDRTAAHTSCVAFGMDRLTVALFCVHGLDLKGWPASTRRALGL